MDYFVDSILKADLSLLALINGFAGRSEAADKIVTFLVNNHIVKGVVPAMVFWALWFSPGLSDIRSRSRLTSVLIVSLVAIAIGTYLATALPHRTRPIHMDGLDVRGPVGETVLEGWSAFPSDHAVLYFALACGYLFVSRPIGLLLLLHAVFVVCLPRIYLGLHYPGDIFAGALIGAAVAFALVPLLSRWKPLHRLLHYMVERYPFLLYPAMFFVTFQFASIFESLRSAVRGMVQLVFA